METKNNKKQIIVKVLAWIGLIIITAILCVMAYAITRSDGKLILAMIVALAFVSILYWIGIKIYKDMVEFENLKYKKEEQKKMNDIARMDTRNI